METPETLQQCVRREQQMIARLRLAMTRLADAERERIWAIVAAREAGLSALSSPGWSHLAAEVELLRWCMAWLEQLEHADHVVVNLRPASEEETGFVPFDRPRVLRALAWIVADLDALARCSLASAEALPDGQKERRAAAAAARRAGAAAATTEPVGRAGRLTTSAGTPAV